MKVGRKEGGRGGGKKGEDFPFYDHGYD